MIGAIMAIGAGTVTLADYAQMSNSPMVQAVTYSLIMNDNVVQDVPLVDRKSLIANGARFEGNLPTVNWSQLNAEGVTTKGTPTPYQEQVYIIRNYIDVDKFIVEDMNQIVEPRSVQTEAYLKALTYDMNNKFLKNDHVTGDANAPVGLRYRIDNGGTFGVRPENKIDASGLDMSQATLVTTPGNANKFLEFLDQLLWSVDSPTGSGVVLYMNEVARRRFAFAVRALGTSGGFETTRDMFNRTVDTYKGATIRDPGYKADQATRILTTTETAAGADGASTMTSVYAVNYGSDHFSGWQFEPPNVQDLGLIYNGAIYRTLIDWAVGFLNASTRSIGRLYDIKIQ
jgi:hypothetical protein